MTLPLEDLRNIFKSTPTVVLAYLFGSHAKNTATPLSDIDFAVLIEPKIIHEYFDFRETLARYGLTKSPHHIL